MSKPGRYGVAEEGTMDSRRMCPNEARAGVQPPDAVVTTGHPSNGDVQLLSGRSAAVGLGTSPANAASSRHQGSPHDAVGSSPRKLDQRPSSSIHSGASPNTGSARHRHVRFDSEKPGNPATTPDRFSLHGRERRSDVGSHPGQSR